MTRHPDIYIAGAPKCGTTSIADYLAQHPHVFVPARREIGYFGRDLTYLRGSGSGPGHRLTEEEYLSRFAEAGEEQMIAVAPVWYLYSKSAAEELARRVPKAKVVVSLREPVSFLRSFHAQMVFSGNETVGDFWEALRLEPARREGRDLPNGLTILESVRYRELPRFAEQVGRFHRALGRQNVLVLLLDDLIGRPREVERLLCSFLQLPIPDGASIVNSNPRREVRSQAVNRLVRRPPAALQAVGRMLPKRARQGAYNALRGMNTRYKDKAAFGGGRDDQRTQALRAEYAEEVDALSALLGRDLEPWKSGQLVGAQPYRRS